MFLTHSSGKYILAVPRKYWDDGDVLHAIRTEYDPWAEDADHEEEEEVGSSFCVHSYRSE
jgi:hypothetical protein